METTVYYESDADLAPLDDRTVAVLGYGNQGRSQALNLRDSGVDVVVGNRPDASRERAAEDGFDAVGVGEAARRGDVVFVLVPDEVAPTVYEEQIAPALDAGDVVNFASGYNVHHGFIDPRDDLDVVLVAPRMIGTTVRDLYRDGRGAPAFLAVHQDATGDARQVALALAHGIGATRAGVIETTFETETTTDLMTEQALFPVFASALLAKYEVEREAGIPPEVVLMEQYLSREMAFIFEKCATRGLVEQMDLHSKTSQYGQLTALEAFDRSGIREFMRERLERIRSGEFAREWATEQAAGTPMLERLRAAYGDAEMIRREQETIDALGLREADGE